MGLAPKGLSSASNIKTTPMRVTQRSIYKNFLKITDSFIEKVSVDGLFI